MHRYFVDEILRNPKSAALALGKLSKTPAKDIACSSPKNMAIILSGDGDGHG